MGLNRFSEDAVNEIRVLASVKHINIIRYRESFIENDSLFIVCYLLLLLLSASDRCFSLTHTLLVSVFLTDH